MIDSTPPHLSIHFPRAYGNPEVSAIFRQSPDDFHVDEVLGFPLSGTGEHHCLFVEKTSHNTHWVQSALADYAGVDEKDIGVCGRKDRHAITRQWFSIYCPPVGKENGKLPKEPIDWSQFSMDGVRILSTGWHSKKLRLGDHQCNRFVITLRDVRHAVDIEMTKTGLSESDYQFAAHQFTGHQTASLLSASEKTAFATLIQHKLGQGVPNYYGAQRFGREGGNLLLANDWLSKGIPPPRKQRSMILSAARSYLFNCVLAARVSDGSWSRMLEGDIANTAHPTGPLWGRGRLATQTDTLMLEQQVLNQFSAWCERIEHLGLKQERRSLVLLPENIDVYWQNNDLSLSFDLPVGTFATSVLAEITQLVTPMN